MLNTLHQRTTLSIITTRARAHYFCEMSRSFSGRGHRDILIKCLPNSINRLNTGHKSPIIISTLEHLWLLLPQQTTTKRFLKRATFTKCFAHATVFVTYPCVTWGKLRSKLSSRSINVRRWWINNLKLSLCKLKQRKGAIYSFFSLPKLCIKEILSNQMHLVKSTQSPIKFRQVLLYIDYGFWTQYTCFVGLRGYLIKITRCICI